MFQNLSIGVVLFILTLLTPIGLLAEKEVEKPKELEVGMIAPEFSLKDENDTERSLSEFLGQKSVVLAFYPKDFTGGWTAELQSLRDKLSDIEETETVLFGVSVDTVDSHKRFKEQEKFGFSLLADTEFEVSKQYSGIMERFNASNRVTFVIDKAGYIRAIDKKVKVQTHGEDVVNLLKDVLPKIEVNQPAPDFIAVDEKGEKHQLSKLKGKENVVLSFYPRDFGRGWTTQVCSLRDESSNFAKKQVKVFGITHNDADSHKKFSEENSLNFPLLVDTNKNLALLYGAAEKPTDKRLKRMSVIIDKNGKIVQIDTEINPSTHGTDIIDFLNTVESPKANWWDLNHYQQFLNGWHWEHP